MEEEKIYTIPLRKEFSKAPRYKRTAKSVKAIKQYLKRHLKSEVKLGKYLNQELWKHGMKNPPPRIKVKVTKKNNIFYAEWINAPIIKEEPKKEKLKAKKEVIDIKKEEAEIKEMPEEKTEVKKETKKITEENTKKETALKKVKKESKPKKR